MFYPVVVEKTNFVILDGHHRVKAFEFLGIKKIPCLLVDYFSEEIKVFQRRQEISVTKKTVLENALKGKLYPNKTTNHVLEKFRINFKLNGGIKMNKLNEKTKTITLNEGRCVWQNRFAC